jgi:outer membrane protein TolC
VQIKPNLLSVPFLIAGAGLLMAQGQAPAVSQPSSGTITITLQDALERAQKYGAQVQAANLVAAAAKEDRVQARAASLPSLSALNQFIYTEGNGTPSGVFVANDGVHIYNEQAVVHEELLSLMRRGEIRLAAANEAAAKARADVAARGLKATVIQDYYAIAAAERRLKNTQLSLGEARRFLDISQKQEQGGEAAHADVIKAQLTVQQRQRDVEDGQLNIEKAKIVLAVLIFPNIGPNVGRDYEIVDDLQQTPKILPPFPETRALAIANSPDLKAAQIGRNAAKLGVTVARYGYLPSLGLDLFYGINANQFAINSELGQATGRSTLPNYQVENRRNLGYAAQATLTIPVWNWGATHSKVKQASLKEQQAELDLSVAHRQLQADIASFYREAQTALAQVQSLQSSMNLSADSLRLTLLRYQAGEATALEVVDAQNTTSMARAAFDDGLLRYRVAMANLQTLTGAF